MSINPLNDISRVYLEQVAVEAFVDPEQGEAPSGRSPLQNVSDHPKASVRKKAVSAFKKQMGKEYGGTWKSRSKDPVAEAAKPDYLDFDKDGNEKESMKKALRDKAKKKVEEAKKPNDGNLANNYPPYDKVTRGDVIAGRLGKDQMGGKKKIAKEEFSNWRDDLIEVVGKIEFKKDQDQKIVEKKVNNKIVINPKLDLGEAIQNLGGQLIEMVEIESFDSILDDLSESEIFLLSDNLIEEVVEEFFQECLEEGYDPEYIENTLVESIELSAALLNEAKVTLGHDTKIKSDRLEKVKTAVKKVGGAVARGAGYVAGAAVRGARAAKREFSKGYARGRGGSSSQASSTSSSSSSDSSSGSSTGSSRPGILGRIGSALKSGLKRVVAKGARAVSRGARNVARRMEGGEKKESPKAAPKAATKKAEKPADPWEGSATTPPKPKAKAKKAAAPKPKAPAKTAAKGKRKSKLDSLLADIRSEQVQIDEKTLTSAETKEKERIVKSMKSRSADFERRYPGRGKEVMYATATKLAKKMAEQAMELQPKTQSQQTQPDPKAKVAAQRAKSAEINILQRRLQAIRQTPAGTPVSGIGG